MSRCRSRFKSSNPTTCLFFRYGYGYGGRLNGLLNRYERGFLAANRMLDRGLSRSFRTGLTLFRAALPPEDLGFIY